MRLNLMYCTVLYIQSCQQDIHEQQFLPIQHVGRQCVSITTELQRHGISTYSIDGIQARLSVEKAFDKIDLVSFASMMQWLPFILELQTQEVVRDRERRVVSNTLQHTHARARAHAHKSELYFRLGTYKDFGLHKERNVSLYCPITLQGTQHCKGGRCIFEELQWRQALLCQHVEFGVT
jgi:hypothetical protein